MKKLSLIIITAALALAVRTADAQTIASSQKGAKGTTGSTGRTGYTGRPMNSATTSQDAGLSTGRSRGGKPGTNSSIGAPQTGTGASSTKSTKRKATSNRNTTSISATQSKSSHGTTGRKGSSGNTGTHIKTPPPQR
jgi:hypothetical protein